jgi:hypothetical protein
VIFGVIDASTGIWNAADSLAPLLFDLGAMVCHAALGREALYSHEPKYGLSTPSNKGITSARYGEVN